MIPHGRELEANARLVNEHLVDSALELVATTRDGGPAEVRDVLARVHEGRYDALCVVLAAMVDPERTPRELIGWVDVPLGLQSRDEPREQSQRRRLPREHGSERGYNQHRARGDMPACSPCLAAHAETEAERAEKRQQEQAVA